MPVTHQPPAGGNCRGDPGLGLIVRDEDVDMDAASFAARRVPPSSSRSYRSSRLMRACSSRRHRSSKARSSPDSKTTPWYAAQPTVTRQRQ